MSTLVRRMPWRPESAAEPEPLLTREWLVTNGLGGYASGTVSGVITRRYHGMLIAALPAPLGRVVMLNGVSERLRFPDGSEVPLGGEELAGEEPRVYGASYLTEFRLESGLPVWRYEVRGVVIEKRLLMPHMQNTVHVTYSLLESNAGASDEAAIPEVRLELRPIVHFRLHESPVSSVLGGPYMLTVCGDRFEITAGANLPTLRLFFEGDRSAFTVRAKQKNEMFYRLEKSRGYEDVGELWSPGYFHTKLSPGKSATLIASTEGWETVVALDPAGAVEAERIRREELIATAHPAAKEGPAAELVLAADQFIISPAGRVEDTARARAAGDEVRTVIAGYHWFTDWGRDTMISLEGLTLATGRHIEAGWILRTFAHYIKYGLIPNMFPEREKEGLYHTVDATLWFFHAIDRYIEVTGDRVTLRHLLPKLRDIVDHHVRGTRFGIGIDPKDGLLRHGEEGYQLTWMDAKVGDWVVTPRAGKAVETNALWYNALCLLAGWVTEEQGDEAAKDLLEHAERARRSFNERFWYEQGGYLFDVVDGERGDDPACRPNQIFSISPRHPVLDRSRWEPVVEVVRSKLLTPVGLRSLAPGQRNYKPRYDGDLRSRDAAYHQGTVWGWLIGPFVDAWLKVHPDDKAGARTLLEGYIPHLDEAGIGTISEIFDAEAPFTPRGCAAQAWSVAEVLRCWIKTASP
ncbi:MAG TPA: amylo-alpha-1,6-glucosidase [Polyangiaceae bacterium]|nr:amylo-alpha-1,6-glucosidase [Polyangiaceae bacterium]